MSPQHDKNKRGQILILVAVSLVVLIGFVGLAIDAGRGYGVKAKLNSAVDAAAIAAARALANGATDPIREASAKQAASDYYTANFPSNYMGATLLPLGIGDVTATHDPQKGWWTVAVTGTAKMPVSLMSILGFVDVTVAATGSTRRRDLDLILVLDTSGSLATPSNAFPLLQAAAYNFVDKFNAGSDRVGFISFASGGKVDVAIDKTAARGFNKTTVKNKITGLSSAGAPSGSTAAAEGMRLALNDINGVPVANRSSLRVIVFFSDGAPNDVPAIFSNGGTLVTGDLYSETTAPATARADRVYRYDQRDTQLGTYSNITTLPNSGFALTDDLGNIVGNIPLASYNNNRTLAGIPYTNTRCNVNKAARNMIENLANTARSQDIQIYSIALGAAVDTPEITFCGYGLNEYGSSILKRLANTVDSDTYNAAQPAGSYFKAPTAADLDTAFSAIASLILRLI